MMYKKPLFAFALLCCFVATASAQRYLGLATGNYSAINSLFLNPANLSGAKEKIVVNLFAVNVSLDNSLGTFSKLGDIGKSNTDAFTFAGDKPFSMLVPALDVRMPGIVVSLNDKMQQGFALTTRVRAMNQFNHFDPSLYSTVTNGNHPDKDYHFVTNNFNWTAHVWSEIGLSYAIQPFESGPHKIKAGITLKYLGGVDYLSFKGKNLDIDYKQGNDTFYASHSDLEFASNAVSANNAYSNGISTSGAFSSLFDAKAGGGFGMDIGVTYTYSFNAGDLVKVDDISIDDVHKLTVSIAVTDIGHVTYKQGKNFVVNVSGNGYMTGKGLSDHVKDYNDFRSYVTTQGFHADTGSYATKVYMPTALVFGVDYQVFKHICINTTYIGNLANRQHYGNSYYNVLAIVPRFENKVFTVGLPITYNSLAGDIKLGLGFRVAGFFFGSDDMMALLSNNQHGFGFYLGGYVPIFKKAKKNRF